MKQVTENLDKTGASDFDIGAKRDPFSPLVIIAGLMVACYLTSNVMAVKLLSVCGVTIFDAGTITFPLAYMLGDVLTEIWGFKTARKVIWLTFFCQVFMAIFTFIGTTLPYPDFTEETASAYSTIFSFVPRITVASLIAFLLGEITNAWTMVKIREKTGRKLLWVRTIGSSLFGYIVDTSIFVLIAFAGTVPTEDLISMIVVQFPGKLAIEAVCATPIAYALINSLRKRFEAMEGKQELVLDSITENLDGLRNENDKKI